MFIIIGRKQVGEYIMTSNVDSSAIFDYVILGAGPAGLQLGYFMEQSQKNYLILDKNDKAGSFFKQFPRHRKLISINKRYTGSDDPELGLKMDWNSLLSDDPNLLFTRYSERYFPHADDYERYLNDYANRFHLNIQYNQNVTHITKEKYFILTTTTGQTWSCRRLIVATGVSLMNKPEFPGSDLIDYYDTVSMDPTLFINKRVFIIGKGNSAFETADHLMETAAVIHVSGEKSIKMSWQTRFVGHLRAVNNNFLDSYQLKSQNAVLDGKVVSIRKENNTFYVTFDFARANDPCVELEYDYVIACTGFRFDDSLFDKKTCPIALAINDRFPKQNACWESVSTPDLYFAGTLTQMRDFKTSTSSVVHGFRYGVRSLIHILNKRYHATPLPQTAYSKDVVALVEHITKRATHTSSLWQQYGVLGDVVFVEKNGFTVLEDLPISYIREVLADEFSKHYFILSLEYGSISLVDPFDVSVSRPAQNDPVNAHEGYYLHPILRYYQQGQLVAEHHGAENLNNKWDSDLSHQKPMQAFIKHCLGI